MRQSERSWRLHEVLVRVDRVSKDMPMMLGVLADKRSAGETVTVSGGDRSDPTQRAALSSIEATRKIDRAIVELHSRAAHLENIRASLLGDQADATETDEHGRLIRDGDGKAIEYCTLHHLVGSNAVARRSIPDPNTPGLKLRVCRWCGDYYDETGRAPTTHEVAMNVNGRRVMRDAS